MRNTARPWWVALETMKELEDCLKKFDQGVSRKRRNWATQQKAEVNKLELVSQLKRTWQSLLRDYFEEAMRTIHQHASDGELLRQNRGTTDVLVEPSGNRVGGLDFM